MPNLPNLTAAERELERFHSCGPAVTHELLTTISELRGEVASVARQRDDIAKERDKYMHLLARTLLVMCPPGIVPDELREEWKVSAETVLKDIYDVCRADTNLQIAKKL